MTPLSFSEPQWEGLFLWAKVIPRLCHNINRVVYAFGGKVDRRISQITPTLLCPPVLDQLRAADCVVNDLLREYTLLRSLSQVCFGQLCALSSSRRRSSLRHV